MSGSPLRHAFLAGSGERPAAPGVRRSVAVLAVLGLLAAVLAASLAPGLPGGARFQAEAAGPGAWAADLGPPVQTARARQAEEIRAMRSVVTGSAALVVVLSLLALGVLHGQGRRLGRSRDRIHRAVGARPADFAAWRAGAAWRLLLLLAGVAVPVGLGVPALLEASFPGRAGVPSRGWASVLLLLVGAGIWLAVERGAGVASARPRPVFRDLLLTSPATLGLLGVAVLYAAGVLHRYAPPGASGSRDVVVAEVDLSGVPVGERRTHLEALLRSRSEAPGRTAGVASGGAVQGLGDLVQLWVDCGRCSEGGMPLPIRTVRARVHAVAPDTFRYLGLPLLRGRDFRAEDGSGSPPVAVVSHALAARHFQGGRAVGRTIRLGDGDWIRVVGVVGDRTGARGPLDHAVYLPLAWAGPERADVVGSPAAVASVASVASGVAEGGPGAAGRVGVPRTGAEVHAVAGWFRWLLTASGLGALLAAVLGVRAAVRAEAAGQRFEVSVHRALGARRRHLVIRFLRTAAVRVSVAVLGGAWASLALVGGLERAVGHLPLVDWVVLGVVALPVATVLVLSPLGPFRAAAREHPGPDLASSG